MNRRKNYLHSFAESQYVKEVIDESNIRTGFFIAILTMGYAIFLSMAYFSYSGISLNQSLVKTLYQYRWIAHAFLFAASLWFVIYSAIYYYKKKTSLVRISVCCYVLACCYFGLHISLLEYKMGQQPITLFLMQTIAFCGLCMHPAHSLLLIFACNAAFYILAVKIAGVGFLLATKIFLFMLALSMISIVRFWDALEAGDAREDLYKMSAFDALTGAQSRYALRNHFNQGIGYKVGMATLDIDFFKQYNDRYGHETGDKVLKVFCEILMDHFGKEAVYRIGGDEFLVVQRNVDSATFVRNCEAVIKTSSNTKVDSIDGIPCSIGYAIGRTKMAEDLRNLFRLSDKKLYEAKENGRNRVCGTEI